MGAFLESPIKDKATEADSDGTLSYAVSGMQGWRVGMEDAHSAVLSVSGLPAGHSFFGVYDGHAGKRASLQCAEKLLKSVMSFIPKDKYDPETISSALRQGFIAFDAELKLGHHDGSGTTAVVSFITPTHFIVANCGDSRAIIAGGTRELWASEDHKPASRSESERIEAAGGFVAMGRVNGTLAVSRALGDFVFKGNTALKPEQQVVSCEPTCTILERKADDDFLIICCDGIFDVMTSPEVTEYVRTKFGELGSLSAVSESLLDHCLELNSRDNMTACLVSLSGAGAGAADGDGARAGGGAGTSGGASGSA